MRLRLALLLVCAAADAQVSVLTYHNDLARTGQNPNEYALSPASVGGGSFERLFAYAVDGEVYGQPLYVPGVYISGKGPHNVVYVATEHDSVYAFDADSNAGANAQPLWSTSFANSGAGIATVPAANVGCGQISPEIGITGTPVIDPAAGTIYLVAMTLENGSYHHRLHALDITTGTERANSPVEVQAAGFVPKNYKQRPGLLLLNGNVYTSWSSHCDIGAYHGWIMAYDAKTLAQTVVYNDTPNGNQGSFWGGGAAPAVDANGNVFVVSGNGSFDGNPDLGESFIRLSPAAGLSVADYFTPYNQAALSNADLDTGSAGTVLLPDAVGSAAHPHLMIGGGKEGRIYLIDRDNMGHYRSSDDGQIPQSLPGAIGALYGLPAYFNNSVYFSAAGDNLKAFSIGNGQLSSAPASKSAAEFGYPGSVPSVSSNGNSNGIVWVLEPTAGGTIHAFDASDVSKELYKSSLGSYVKYSTPTIANGKVYAGTENTLAVYGLSPALAAPAVATNGATFTTGPLAPGSIVSLFGNFGVGTAAASSGALPATLGGVQVAIGGILAPLYYVSATQINAQVPFEVALGQAAIVVSAGGAVVASGTAAIQATAPELFTPEPKAAEAGSIVTAYLTGLGAVQPALATGAVAPLNPLETVSGVTAQVGSQAASVQFAGLSPGSVGLYQVNFQIPQLAAGQYSLTIGVNGALSNAVTISVAAQ